MTFKPLLLAVVCSLLSAVPGCFSDKGPAVDGSTGSTESGESGGDTVVTGESGDPSLAELCGESMARRGEIAAAQCQCQVDQGMYSDVDACLAATGGATTADACTCEVYGRAPATRAGLECATPGQEAVLGCIQGLSCAQDSAAFDACINTYYTAISTCAAPPREVAGEVALTCEMVPPLLCGSGEAVPETWKCDLKSDCMDGSDEVECEGTFLCEDGKGSIDEELKCDDFPDCADGSDEAGCPTFMCTSGKVIPLIYRCDGVSDCCAEAEPNCADQSDELNCPTFMCADGTTVPLGYKCDGVNDCEDGSDEATCMTDAAAR